MRTRRNVSEIHELRQKRTKWPDALPGNAEVAFNLDFSFG